MGSPEREGRKGQRKRAEWAEQRRKKRERVDQREMEAMGREREAIKVGRRDLG